MTYILPPLCFIVVLLFGIILTAGFAEIKITKGNIVSFLLLTAFICILHIATSAISNYFKLPLSDYLMPLIKHLPIILFLKYHLHTSFLKACMSVFAAYICRLPISWIANIALTYSGYQNTYYLIQIILLPLSCIAISKFLLPFCPKKIGISKKLQIVLALIPTICYIFNYITVFCTDLLYSGNIIAIGFIPTLLVVFYFLFVTLYFNETEKRSEFESSIKVLNMQAAISQKEIESLKKAQEQSAIYRHDLRHHMQYLDTCIKGGNTEEALEYIEIISQDMDNQKTTTYCENQTVNLMISSYILKAETLGIVIMTKLSIPSIINISATTLCMILANALENAINACKILEPITRRVISVICYQKKAKSFLQIQNPYDGDIIFVNELPIATEKNHGNGTKSIMMAVQRNNGLCSFEAQNGTFTVRITV